jgi:hypothetical protein
MPNTTQEANFLLRFFPFYFVNFKKIFNRIVVSMFNHIFYYRLVERKKMLVKTT